MHVPWFHQSLFCPPKKWPACIKYASALPRRAASKPPGAWQGNEKGISRVKVDLRTPSQEKGHKRFIANHFQKVELKVVGFFQGFYQLRVPLVILGRYIFKKPCTLLLLKATSASLLCETPTQTGNGTNGTRCQSEKKLSPINLLSYLFPVPQRAP